MFEHVYTAVVDDVSKFNYKVYFLLTKKQYSI